MDKMISVILPVYNRQAYISECLRSIQNQSYGNFEILIIDDGSADRSLELCRDAAKADIRIRIMEGSHQGVSAARNLGLQQARGEYLLFVDSDDVIHPRFMEVMLQGMEQENTPMAASMRVFVPAAQWETFKEKVFHSTKEPETVRQDHAQALDGLLTGKTAFTVMGGVMIRRDLVDAVRFHTDLTIGEDFYFRNRISRIYRLFGT